MSTLFFDSSALVKRYVSEIGSNWVSALTEPTAGNVIVVAEITRVEVAAALAARQRVVGGLTRAERDHAVDLLLRHSDREYRIAALTPTIVGKAVNLTQDYRLRGNDAVQLATALVGNSALAAAGLGALTFIASDRDLLAAALAQGLEIENPQDHLSVENVELGNEGLGF